MISYSFSSCCGKTLVAAVLTVAGSAGCAQAGGMTIFDFNGTVQGASPQSTMLLGPGGRLYGALSSGGGSGPAHYQGALFALLPPKQ